MYARSPVLHAILRMVVRVPVIAIQPLVIANFYDGFDTQDIRPHTFSVNVHALVEILCALFLFTNLW